MDYNLQDLFAQLRYIGLNPGNNNPKVKDASNGESLTLKRFNFNDLKGALEILVIDDSNEKHQEVVEFIEHIICSIFSKKKRIADARIFTEANYVSAFKNFPDVCVYDKLDLNELDRFAISRVKHIRERGRSRDSLNLIIFNGCYIRNASHYHLNVKGLNRDNENNFWNLRNVNRFIQNGRTYDTCVITRVKSSEFIPSSIRTCFDYIFINSIPMDTKSKEGVCKFYLGIVPSVDRAMDILSHTVKTSYLLNEKCKQLIYNFLKPKIGKDVTNLILTKYCKPGSGLCIDNKRWSKNPEDVLYWYSKN